MGGATRPSWVEGGVVEKAGLVVGAREELLESPRVEDLREAREGEPPVAHCHPPRAGLLSERPPRRKKILSETAPVCIRGNLGRDSRADDGRTAGDTARARGDRLPDDRCCADPARLAGPPRSPGPIQWSADESEARRQHPQAER